MAKSIESREPGQEESSPDQPEVSRQDQLYH